MERIQFKKGFIEEMVFEASFVNEFVFKQKEIQAKRRRREHAVKDSTALVFEEEQIGY